MPFDENEEEVVPAKNAGLKKVSSQKSIFDNIPKKPSQDDFQKRVASSQERLTGYKLSVSQLTQQFLKLLNDKTLKQNKNLFDQDIEKEVIANMIQLAQEINNDPAEQEGMGSLSWITILLKVALSQRNRINDLEYRLSVLEKKANNTP